MNSQETHSRQAYQVIRQVRKAVIGKDDCIRKVMMAILSSGHILLEDIPGVGKTTMALAFSRALNLKEKRLTFTPDVLPADLTGFTMYRKETGQFYYQPGAVMCNLFLGMRSTVPRPDPVRSAGSHGRRTGQCRRRYPSSSQTFYRYRHPESGRFRRHPAPSQSQLDRFTVCLTIGYPDMEEEISILKGRIARNTIEQVQPAADSQDSFLCRKRSGISLSMTVSITISADWPSHQNNPMIELGVSPRGSTALARMAQASAYLRNKTYVTPDDIRGILMDVWAHRILLNAKARISHLTPDAVLEEILKSVPAPSLRKT